MTRRPDDLLLGAALVLGMVAAGCSSSDTHDTTASGGHGGSTTTATAMTGGGGSGGEHAGGGGQSAGGGGNGGNGGGADALAPMPIISRGVPAFASSGKASDANDADYETLWRSSETTSTATPSWLAYDLSGVPAAKRGKVDVVWYAPGGGYAEYDLLAKPGAVTYNVPKDYTIESNDAPGGGAAPTTGWKPLATVKGTTLISKQALVDLDGAKWIRLHVTAVNGTDQNYNTAVNLDVHDASKGLEDSWLFLGDSITAFVGRNDGAGIGDQSFAELIHAGKPGYFPAAEGAGEGGWNSGTAFTIASPDGNGTLFDYWIRNFPGRFVCLSYGTNDGANAGNGGQATNDNFVKMIKVILDAGKIPAIPHVPWAEDGDHQTGAMIINAKIDALYQTYPTLVRGPDLYGVLTGHTEWFMDDLHPNPQGVEAYRKAWADAVLPQVYP